MAEQEYATHELLQPTSQQSPPAAPPTIGNDQPAQVDRDRDDSGRFVRKADEAPEAEAEDLEAAADDAEQPADDGDSEPEAEKEDSEEKSRRRRTARERISQLTARAREAEARAEMAERRARQLQEYLQQAQPDPNLEFENPAQFTEQSVERALARREFEQSRQAIGEAKAAKLESAREMFMARLEAVRDELPDFDQVFTPDIPVTDVGVEFLGESEFGPQVAHHLGKNPALARRIATLDPIRQGIELARLEAQVRTPPPKRTTKAPPPARRLATNGATGGFNPANPSVDDISRLIYGGRR